MANAVSPIYWDSSVFLSYLEQLAGRADILNELVARARRGEIEIVTSVVTVVEVAYLAAERSNKQLSEADRQKIDDLWNSRRAIRLLEFHELIARDARRLIREGLTEGWALKPYDAVHLATASRARVAECHTYDPKWEKYREKAGIAKLCEPHAPGGFQPSLLER